MKSRTRRYRVRIERLDLELHGIAPETARAAARALGPALAEAFVQQRGQSETGSHIAGEKLVTTASPGAHELAAGIARRVVQRVRGQGS